MIQQVDGFVNIMIQGLFIMEHVVDGQSHVLDIIAPGLDDHSFVGGVFNNLIPLDGEDLQWQKNTGLIGRDPQMDRTPGIPDDVPLTVPQFSRTTTLVGDLVKAGHKGRIRLPWPLSFFSLRPGSIPKYTTRPVQMPKTQAQQVGNNIIALCSAKGNTELGVVSGFTYRFSFSLPYLPGWTPTIDFNFYFQPSLGHTINDVNNDLIEVSGKHFEKDNFDLQIDTASGGIIVPPGSSRNIPLGIGLENELALNESLFPTASQRDISKLNQLLAEQFVGIRFDEGKQALKSFFIVGSTANCPNFFVGQ